MPLQSYVQSDQTLPSWASLQRWYQNFSDDPVHEWVRRNIDRECERHDIDQAVWAGFLRKVVDYSDSNDPLEPINRILDRQNPGRTHFLLAGLPLRMPDHDLYRYVRLDALSKHLSPDTVPISRNLNRLAEAIANGAIGGTALEHSAIGRPESVIWCTGSQLSAERNGDVVRDRLGLKHIESGRIVEIAYSPNLLLRGGIALRAPTVLDASAEGAANWVWVKNKQRGAGPDWGYTVDLSHGAAGARGCAEAVHESFELNPGSGSDIHLRVLDPLRTSPPGMDYRMMMNNTEL